MLLGCVRVGSYGNFDSVVFDVRFSRGFLFLKLRIYALSIWLLFLVRFAVGRQGWGKDKLILSRSRKNEGYV